MKKDIHPKYFDNAKIHCACGALFEIGATQESMDIEICSQCHPFYTGKERNSEQVGRIQKFRQRAAAKKK